MGTEAEPKKPNIKLREGQEPITVSGFASVGNLSEGLAFPTRERQEAGWCSKHAALIAACYPDRYEQLNKNGGCCKDA